MQVLVDTDAFCKLGISNLFEDALALFEAGVADCGRLPEVPYMLRKGRLPRIYGPDACNQLMELAAKVPPIGAPDSTWLDRVVAVPSIDPGEAQLFALGASGALLVVTGDKRALLALSGVEGYPEAMGGRIAVIEAVLLALCDRLGPEVVRARLGPLMTTDVTLKICFSPDNPQPETGLESYLSDLALQVNPLRLWRPPTRGTA